MEKEIKIIKKESEVVLTNESLTTKASEEEASISPGKMVINAELVNMDKVAIKIGDKILPLKTEDIEKQVKFIIEKEDNLQFMMDCQRKFQSRFGQDFNNMTAEERTDFIKVHGYFVIEELVEMFRECPFHKPWKDYSDWTDSKMLEQWEKAREEYIDVLHFIINIGLALQLDSEDILKMYKDKNKVNIERQENPELGYVK